jgi:hypothetical protein
MRFKLISVAIAGAFCLAGAAQAAAIVATPGAAQLGERAGAEDLRCVFVALSGGDAKGSEAGTSPPRSTAPRGSSTP